MCSFPTFVLLKSNVLGFHYQSIYRNSWRTILGKVRGHANEGLHLVYARGQRPKNKIDWRVAFWEPARMIVYWLKRYTFGMLRGRRETTMIEEKTIYFKYTTCFPVYWGFGSWNGGLWGSVPWLCIPESEPSPPYIHTFTRSTQTDRQEADTRTDVSRNGRVNMIVTHPALTYMLQKLRVSTEMISIQTVSSCCWVCFFCTS